VGASHAPQNGKCGTAAITNTGTGVGSAAGAGGVRGVHGAGGNGRGCGCGMLIWVEGASDDRDDGIGERLSEYSGGRFCVLLDCQPELELFG
jgi:hypothetical protein